MLADDLVYVGIELIFIVVLLVVFQTWSVCFREIWIAMRPPPPDKDRLSRR